MFIVGEQGGAMVNMDNCCALDIREETNHKYFIEAFLANNNNRIILGIYNTYSEACEVVEGIGKQMQSTPCVIFV